MFEVVEKGPCTSECSCRPTVACRFEFLEGRLKPLVEDNHPQNIDASFSRNQVRYDLVWIKILIDLFHPRPPIVITLVAPFLPSTIRSKSAPHASSACRFSAAKLWRMYTLPVM